MKQYLFPTLAAAAAAMAGQMVVPSEAEAALPIEVTTGGVVTGVDDIVFNGTLYDVTFSTGSCSSIFTDCGGNVASFAFTSGVQARSASNLLANVLEFFYQRDSGLNLGSCGNFGPNASGFCDIVTPFSTSGSNVSAFKMQFNDSFSNSFTSVSSVTLPSTTNLPAHAEYAIWTQVPEPVSTSIFAVGVAAAAAARAGRRKKKST